MDSQDIADIRGGDEFIKFPAGAPIQLPAGFPPLPMNIYSRFGFKLMTLSEEGCADVQVWALATEDDYRAMKATFLNVRPEELDDPIIGTPPCHMWNGGCTGGCSNRDDWCIAIVSIRRNMITCICGYPQP
ncbi:hypothetical protein [Streptosporangium sp. H16]|uniref:hypothetical protein n=1 Tax=Streptosporangium sp. H16 TaxID=3444184 RepID=UPI003F792F1B